MVVAKSANMFSPHKWPFLCLVSVSQPSSRLMFFSRERIYKLYCITGSRAARRMDDRVNSFILWSRSDVRLSFRTDKSLSASIVAQFLIENLESRRRCLIPAGKRRYDGVGYNR